MVRLGKLTDYGLVLMTCIARTRGSRRSARPAIWRVESKLPLSTVSKLLKELLQSGLLVSHRGIKGGYMLAREPQRDFGDRHHCRDRGAHGPHRVQHRRHRAVQSRVCAARSRAISGSSTRRCEVCLRKSRFPT